MIHSFTKLEDLKKALSSAKIQRDINSLLKLELPFFDYQDKVSILYFPIYGENDGKCLIVISKKNIFVYAPDNFGNPWKSHKQLLTKPHGESTVMTFLVLKFVLKNYSEQLKRIRD